MALQFPTNPSDGQQVTLNGKVWRYDATKGVWSVPTVSSTQSVVLARTELTATAGQTVLNVTYNTSYGVDVSINGLQMLSTDFTATDGSTITLTEALAAGDQVVVLAATGAPGGLDLSAVDQDIIPDTTEAYDLGSATNRWRDIYLSGNSIDLGGATITSDGSAIALPAGSSVGSTPLGGVQVYADTDALVASSPSSGALGFVSANNRLYMYTGAGWFNIALINTSPTITQGGAGSYALATDGTPTVITLVAEDPEGLPITWSYTAVALENHATISQADNVFTITPSTNTADAGEFTITFTASDGVNIATDVNSFSLGFLSALWDETVLSIGTNSTDGLDNSTFIDRSSNAHTVTTSGSPVQTVFHPYLDNWSIEIPSGTHYAQLATNSAYAISDAFTLELWWKTAVESAAIFTTQIGSDNNYWGINISSGYVQYNFRTSALQTNGTGNVYVADNKWHHIAMVRESGSSTVTIYVDGQSDITFTFSTSLLQDPVVLAAGLYPGFENYSFIGHISNARISDVARYTSNFTPSTENLASDSNTKLLACQDNRFVDRSPTNNTFTLVGTPKISALNPFGQGSEYAPGENKGSAYIPQDSYINIAHDASQTLGGNDFTIEWWMNLQATVPNDDVLIDKGWGGSSYGELLIYNKGGNYLAYMSSTGSTWNILSQFDTGWEQKLNEWQHFAIVRNGSQVAFFVNGKLTAGSTNIGSNSLFDTGDPITICSSNGGVKNHPATYISDFKWTVGTVAYDATGASVGDQVFTPPTAPVGNTNASLYLPMDNAGIFDKTGNNTLTLVGNTTTSTTQTKFADTAMYFDGSGDYITIEDTTVGNLPTDFTIEGWFNFSALSTNRMLIENWASGVNGSWQIYWRGTGTSISFYNQDAGTVLQDPAGSTITTGTWYHIAVCRSGSTIKLFIDGNEKDSATFSTSLNSNRNVILGRQGSTGTNYFQGYMEDVQILKGAAKYTTNFTPPTQTQGREYQAES